MITPPTRRPASRPSNASAPPICPRACSRNWRPLSTAIGEIYRYVLKGDGYSTRDLRTLEDWVVERNFRAVPGVADVVTFGGLVKTYEVNPQLARMRYYGISLAAALYRARPRQRQRRRQQGHPGLAAISHPGGRPASLRR